MGSKATSRGDVLQAIESAQALAREYVQGGHATQDGRYELSTAAMDLTSACQTPNDIAARLVLETACPSAALRVAIEAGWTDVLKEKKSVTADELVEKCDGEKNVVVRVMRVLTASKLAQEIGFQEYAATDVMMVLLQPSMKDLFTYCLDEMTVVLCNLSNHLSSTSFAEPCDENTDPYTFTFGKSIWKRHNEEPLLNERFNNSMTVSYAARGIPAECFLFDAEAARLNLTSNDIFLVDIGGGMGHQTLRIRNMYPSIPGRVIVQDLPHVVEYAKTQKDVVGAGIEFQWHDMFKPQPVEGAAFYFLSAIMHDWADGPCLVVLRHVRKAMRKGLSRLLVADFVLPDVGANLAVASQDLWMMAGVCGKERTKGEWEHLLSQAGLKIKGIHQKGVAQMLEVEIGD